MQVARRLLFLQFPTAPTGSTSTGLRHASLLLPVAQVESRKPSHVPSLLARPRQSFSFFFHQHCTFCIVPRLRGNRLPLPLPPLRCHRRSPARPERELYATSSALPSLRITAWRGSRFTRRHPRDFTDFFFFPPPFSSPFSAHCRSSQDLPIDC